MKITKRQLRRIIKEEKAKLLRESVTDMVQIDAEVTEASRRIAGQFLEMMFQLFRKEPDMFDGHSTEAEWELQVNVARGDLEDQLRETINKTIERVEMSLHGGDYHTGNR